MRFHSEPAPAGTPASQLWLMLPGAYMTPADFIAAGCVDAVRRRGLPWDIALLEASIPEVADGSALRFLQQFLCDEAQHPGRRIHLFGISLGAHLAMACLSRAPQGGQPAEAAARVAGACLLAPYLGPRDVAAGIAAAGSLAQWQPGPALEGDIDLQIWSWLQQCCADADGPALFLGYGSDDRFARAHALMAQALPAERVDVVPGGHVWPVWAELWNRHLERHHGH